MSSFLLWRLSHKRQALSAPPHATTAALFAAAAMQKIALLLLWVSVFTIVSASHLLTWQQQAIQAVSTQPFQPHFTSK